MKKQNKIDELWGTGFVPTPWWRKQVDATWGELAIVAAMYGGFAVFIIWLFRL